MPPSPRTPAGLRRLLLVASGCAVALTACGAPPELAEPGAAGPGRAVRTPDASASVPATTASTAGVLPAPGPSTATAPAGATAPDTATAPATAAATVTATAGAGEAVAVPCDGAPGGVEVLRALRRAPGLLPDGIRLRVKDGPYCAGTWQYATVRVLRSPEPEPLQVVTRGRPSTLTVVTAGTDVCSIPVRAEAPDGIRALACEAPPIPGPANPGPANPGPAPRPT